MLKKKYITYLNVFAAFSVVMLHNNGIVHLHPTGKTWYSAIFIETFFYCAVPLFFMISGTNLIDYKKRYSTKEFLKKRIKKTGVPFLLWSIIAIFYFCIRKRSFEILTEGLLNIISNIFNTTYITIYWFFPHLFAFYLCIPILSELKNKMRTFKYMIIVSFIFLSTLPFICNLLSITYNYELVPKFVSGYVIYGVIGYYLANTDVSKKQRFSIYLIGFIGFLFNFIGTAYLTEPGGDIYQLFRGPFNWPTLFQSIAIFTLFKYFPIENKRLDKIISWFGKKTFGIYLIHIYLVNELPNILNINNYNLLWRIFGGFFIFVLSAGITDLIQRVPFIKKIVP